MVNRYRKKPVEVEAVVWNGNNEQEIVQFVGEAFSRRDRYRGLYIKTLEGTMRVSTGDYIIKGIQGEFCVCKPDAFKETYEEAARGQGGDRALTLGELKELSGEPVWIRFIEAREMSSPYPGLLIGVNRDGVAVMMTAYGVSFALLTSKYGFTWVAYDHRPEVKVDG